MNTNASPCMHGCVWTMCVCVTQVLVECESVLSRGLAPTKMFIVLSGKVGCVCVHVYVCVCCMSFSLGLVCANTCQSMLLYAFVFACVPAIACSWMCTWQRQVQAQTAASSAQPAACQRSQACCSQHSSQPSSLWLC